jgi:putative nucleotidyltransferase with HDIG domain
LFGTCAGTITVALEILIIIVAGVKATREPMRILFNVAAAALSIWLSSNLFFAVAQIEPLAGKPVALGPLILPLALLATSYFVLNSGLVAIAVALQRNTSALTLWRTNLLPIAVNYLGGASVAALFVSYTRTIDVVAFGVIVPLLVISYLTFKYSFSRIEDATQHVEEIKRLYLSTIETLATAIDAKDQVTHGHIRRVQQLALALARELGVKDDSQLQALQAAALLHDTGKLAIPEHILNKPGKLTRGEFEKMKEHARLGAEILSSIEFPYPVVPIVRHHHECWDGTGYPDQIRGTQIPIGARILAVVDCFDALTSDRPYRPRMSDADALAILLQRRGTMYDPLIVDTFAVNCQTLLRELVDRVPSTDVTHVPTRAAAAVTEMPPNARAFAHSALGTPLDQFAATVLEKTNADVVIVFASDHESDQLLSLVVRTRNARNGDSVSMPLGYGVSGWVAVTATPLINADPSLDFRETPPFPGLVRSLCVPVLHGQRPAGVVSIYTSDPRGFNEDDKVLVEELLAESDAGATFSTFLGGVRTKKARPESSTTVH